MFRHVKYWTSIKYIYICIHDIHLLYPIWTTITNLWNYFCGLARPWLNHSSVRFLRPVHSQSASTAAHSLSIACFNPSFAAEITILHWLHHRSKNWWIFPCKIFCKFSASTKHVFTCFPVKATFLAGETSLDTEELGGTFADQPKFVCELWMVRLQQIWGFHIGLTV